MSLAAEMALYPTVPVCMQLTDYELETPHLGVAPVYRLVPQRTPPSLYPPLYDVEPSPSAHHLPEYVALVGVHPMYHGNNSSSLMTQSAELQGKEQEVTKTASKSTQLVKQIAQEKETKMLTKEVILNRKEGRFGLRTEVDGARVLVSHVTRGWPAGAAGLRRGDQLLSVNGTTLSGLSRERVQHVIRACPPVGIKFTFRTRKDLTIFKKLENLRKSLDEL